jgi:hypothetical protein
MTRFISVRSQDVGGPVVPAFVLDSGGGPSPTYRQIDSRVAGDAAAGRDLILAIHGFNVSRANGVRSLVALEAALELTPDQAFFGVLWPGDFWLPVVNYPAEASDAVKSGANVAALLNGPLRTAASISFISHSLGGRVLLETLRKLDRPAREVCVAAGAVDDDCLSKQYVQVRTKVGRISVLASKADKVLQLAYPLGDFASDLFWRDNDSPWRAALGRSGPKPQEFPPLVNHRQIPKDLGYGHGDYFPPGGGAAGLWSRAVGYMRRSVNGQPDLF